MTDKKIDYAQLKSGGAMRQRQEDLFSMRLRIVGGKLTAEQLRALADAAEKYGEGEIHLTSRQGVEVSYVHLDDINNFLGDLEKANVHKGACGPRVRTVIACQGNLICPRGLIDAQDIAQKVDEKYFGAEAPGKFKIAATGCPASCMKVQENDFGIIGGVEPKWIEEDCINCGLCEKACRVDAIKLEEGTVKIDMDKCNLCSDCIFTCPTDAWVKASEGYTIYVGGKVGRKPKWGTKITQLVDEATLFDILEKSFQFYRDNASAGERFADTIERIGIETFKDTVLP